MTRSKIPRPRPTDVLTTFAPVTFLVLATALALHTYDIRLHDNLPAARLLALWGTAAAFILVPLWTAIRAGRSWLITLLPQLGILGVQLLLTFAMLVKTPHGMAPPTCGTPMAALFMTFALGYLTYCAAAIPVTATIGHYRRRRAKS